MRVLHVVAETPSSFLQHLKDITFIERKPLRYAGQACTRILTSNHSHRFCSERLTSLVRTLELQRVDEYSALQKVAAFATLVATYDTGFLLILEPFETENATVSNPVFHLTCARASCRVHFIFKNRTAASTLRSPSSPSLSASAASSSPPGRSRRSTCIPRCCGSKRRSWRVMP